VDSAERARALAGDIEEMAESLGRSLWDKVPGYEVTALDRAELISAIRASVRVVLACLAEGRLPNESELEPARTLGERRAVQGVPIESVVGSWHSAERFFIERLLGVGDNLSAAEVRETNQRVAQVIDRMTEKASSAYNDIRGEVQPQFSQASADIVSSLVGTEHLEPGEIERRARLIGAEPELPHRVVALGTQRADGLMLTKARRLVAESLRPHTVGRVLAGSHQGYQLLVVTDHADMVAVVQRAMRHSALPGNLSAGLGEPRPRLAEASGSAREAISALQVALILDLPIARFEEVVPEVLLRENPASARAMVRAVLGPVDHGDLIETLQTFLSSGLSVRATARQLQVHENTVSYRVKRILEAMGVSSANDLVRPDIQLALRAREVLPTDA
jgi:hypothetical protein